MAKGEGMTLREVYEVYLGSDGERTRALYARLEALGAAGVVALNLFRAQKCSSRAKVYRGGLPGLGSFRGAAYERKQWSLDNVCAELEQHAGELGLRWGWREDARQVFHRWVLYVELPTGQVSFHAAARGRGPEYPGEWDGKVDASAGRIVTWAARLLKPTEDTEHMEHMVIQGERA
jgi:hypothetical protein